MAMNATTLKTAMKVRLTSEGFNLSDPASKAEKMIDIICEEIINHIVTFGTVAVTSVSGITTGTGLSGPGVGTIL